MRYTLLPVFLLSTGVLWSIVSAAPAQTTVQHRKDSLYRTIALTEGKEKLQTYNRLASLYMQEINREHIIDTLFAIYDEMDTEARRQNEISWQGTARQNKLTALSNKRMHDELVERLPAELDFFERNNLWRQYYQSATLLVNMYRSKRELEKAIDEAQKIYEHAREHQHAGGMGMAFYAMSQIYSNQRRRPEAEQSLRECIELLKDSTSYYNLLTNAWNSLACNLLEQKRYDDAWQTIEQCEKMNRMYEEASGSPQPGVWINHWLACNDICRQTGEYDKAEMYLDKVDSISRGTIRMYEDRAHIHYGRKEYDKALEMVDKAIEVASNKLSPKGLKLMILIEAARAQSAYNLFCEVIAELDSTHNARFDTRVDELRTQYEVDKHVAEKERNRNYFLFALGVCLLLAVLLVCLSYYNRVIARKNRGLYLRIKEQDRLKGDLQQLKQNYEALILSAAAPDEAGETAGEFQSLFSGNRQQRELVDRFNEYLFTDRNFAKADIDRDEIAVALLTNKNVLSDAVKSVTGETLKGYIRGVQLQEARRMLDSYPELTIEAISMDCGFNSTNTFYRLFRRYYEITPSEYRKSAAAQ